MSGTYTNTQTFTVTNARYLSSKVKTDLKRVQRFYGHPDDARIDRYDAELTALLAAGYLEEVTYGFKRNGNWIEPTLRYTAANLAAGANDNPGAIRTGANVSGAKFASFMAYNSKWDLLSDEARERFEATLPFRRGTAPRPGVSGYLEDDKSYASGGVSLSRKSVRAV